MDNNLVPLRHAPVRDGIPDAPHFMTLASEGWGKVGEPPPPRIEPIGVDVELGGIKLAFDDGYMQCMCWDDATMVRFHMPPIVAEEIASALRPPKGTEPLVYDEVYLADHRQVDVGECVLYRGEATSTALFLFIRSSERDALVRVRVPMGSANSFGATWRDAVAAMRAMPREEKDAVIEQLSPEERANHRVARWTREDEQRANGATAPKAPAAAPATPSLLDRASVRARFLYSEATFRIGAAVNALLGKSNDD